MNRMGFEQIAWDWVPEVRTSVFADSLDCVGFVLESVRLIRRGHNLLVWYARGQRKRALVLAYNPKVVDVVERDPRPIDENPLDWSLDEFDGDATMRIFPGRPTQAPHSATELARPTMMTSNSAPQGDAVMTLTPQQLHLYCGDSDLADADLGDYLAWADTCRIVHGLVMLTPEQFAYLKRRRGQFQVIDSIYRGVGYGWWQGFLPEPCVKWIRGAVEAVRLGRNLLIRQTERSGATQVLLLAYEPGAIRLRDDMHDPARHWIVKGCRPEAAPSR